MRRSVCRRAGFAAIAAIAIGSACPLPAPAAEASVECTVLYETPDGFYVDAGSDSGLVNGDRGTVEREGKPIAQVEVIETSSSSALLRLLFAGGQSSPGVGDRVQILVSTREAEDGAGARSRSSTLRSPGEEEEDFQPLLAPQQELHNAVAERRNIFHGRLYLHQLLQMDDATLRDFSISRLGSDGSLDRIQGTPWILEWSGDLSYRTGEALENTRDFEEWIPHIFRLSLFRRFGDDSMVRLGRFLPRELTPVGYIDGLQAEKVLGEHFRIGAIAGLKPTRDRLALSADEPLVVPYATVTAGHRGGTYYSGTAGLLGSLYKGDADRLAALLQQTLSLGRRITLYSTTEVDFDIGGAETRSGVNLTHLDAFANYDILDFLSLRAGLDHWERPDTAAERDLLEFQDPEFFNAGFWRYWAGASASLPWSLRLSGEVGAITSEFEDIQDIADLDPIWQASLTKLGLPLMPAGSVTLSVYNFEGDGVDGYGGRISAYLPFLENRLFLEPAAAFRSLDLERENDKFKFTDISLRITWLITRSWSAHAGASYAFGSDVDRTFIDLGIAFQW